ncbi:MAG: PLP-dependent aminotransferase family protein [Micrococcales bacterium]|nr:PLP-dependent aminotransferase family protein [Micrococcales bacterium]
MPRTPVDFPVTLDRGLPTPLPGQIAAAVRVAVAGGTLRPGDLMPSTRALAERLGVSRGTASAAYDQLHAEAYLESRPRSSVVINPALRQTNPPPDAEAALGQPVTPPRAVPPAGRLGGGRQGLSAARGSGGPHPAVLDLTPGRDRVSPLADGAWRSAWRRATRESGAVDALDPGGTPGLREAIAAHLRLMRGMAVDPERIVVTAGAREGLTLLLSALRQADAGELRVGVEEPGFPGLRRALRHQHVEIVPVPVDEHGIRVDRLHGLTLDALLVTPNHQFPYGTAMPATRRVELLEWATATHTLLIEDDYDSEFRYLGPPLPSLYDLADDGVAHLGTFAMVLTRDVGTGYLVLPRRLVSPVRAARSDAGHPVAPILQRAVATYLVEGGLRRHIHRSRKRLAAAQQVVADALPRLPAAVDTGRLLVVELKARDRDRVLAATSARGVRLGDLASGWSGSAGREGVVAAYDGLEPAEVEQAVEVLSDVLLRRGRARTR